MDTLRERPPRPDSSPQLKATTLAGIQVFVAEDEPILLWALEELLEGLGCTVAGSATRVTEALAFVASNSFDVAVLDGSLADGSILPLVNILAARGTPFVMASGLSSSDFPEAFSSGVFVRKPYNGTELRQALVLALEKCSRLTVSPH
jgi:CheY-like chemotaxis protein